MNELLQSDAIVFGIAMFGIAVSSVAILRDYLPREEPQFHARLEPVEVPSSRMVDRAA